MRTTIILTLLLALSACAEGRWVARDLSSLSFQFAAPEPSGPFAKPPKKPGVSPLREAPQDLAAVGR